MTSVLFALSTGEFSPSPPAFEDTNQTTDFKFPITSDSVPLSGPLCSTSQICHACRNTLAFPNMAPQMLLT
jgi:hypothetical protein